MKDLETKGAQGYEHTSTKVASYVKECGIITEFRGAQ